MAEAAQQRMENVHNENLYSLCIEDDVEVQDVPESSEEVEELTINDDDIQISSLLTDSERSTMEESLKNDLNTSEELYKLNKSLNVVDKSEEVKKKVENVKNEMMMEKLFEQLFSLYQDGISAISDISDQMASGFIGATSSLIFLTTFMTLFTIWTAFAIVVAVTFGLGYIISKFI